MSGSQNIDLHKIGFPVIPKNRRKESTMKDIKELVKDYLAENHAWCKNANGEYHFEIDVD